MKKYSHETIAGVFVFFGLVCLAYMTVKIGNVSIFGDDTYTLFARFKTVSGLRVGNPIEMVGIEVGKVTKFSMDQDKQVAVVELKIKNGVKVYDDAIASIKTAGLLGDKYVSIDPGGGTGKVLKPGDFIIDTVHSTDLQELIGKYAFGSVQDKKPEKKEEGTL